MYSVDFEYDNRYLSDYGFIICDFNSNNGANEVEVGSVITFNRVSHHSGKKYSLSSTQYDEYITATFDICKDSDIFEREEMEISNDEYRDIVRWLNRRGFFKFRVIDDNGINFNKDVCYYNASFNVKKITIGDKLYGIRLSMETDSPFGYGCENETILNFTSNYQAKKIKYISDEIGFTYPTVIITCKRDCNLTISNTTLDSVMSIKNCVSGEVITVYGDTHIITTSISSHDICNDFNYEFLKIGNSLEDEYNTITASYPCDVVIKYAPIIKDIPN